MKTIILFVLLLTLSSNLLSQSQDSVVFDSAKLLLVKNLESKRYILTNKKTKEKLENLKFAKLIFCYFQIKDSENNIFYIGDSGEIIEDERDFIGMCGTVPHYSLSIKERLESYEISEDETFYDYGNEIPAQVIKTIYLTEADSVLFINGKKSFTFTSNFGYGKGNTDPRMFILYKDGKYFTTEHPKLKYDAIDFSNYNHSLITMSDNLFDVLDVVDPKYKKIEMYKYYLATAETVDGKTIIIDIEGNEYY